MAIPESIRGELGERRLSLIRRIERLEAEIEQAGSRNGVSRERLCEVFPVIEEIASTESHELGLVENALRRIAAREYDCCMTCGGQIGVDRLEAYPYMVNCESCAQGFGVEYVQHLRAQHVELRRMIASLGSALDAVNRTDSANLGMAACRVMLEDLAGLVPDHFALEERGGYFADALAVAPQLSRQAETLLAQHADFRRRLGALHERAQAAGYAPERWRPVAAGFRRLAVELLRHEREEATLVREAFGDDLGSGD